MLYIAPNMRDFSRVCSFILHPHMTGIEPVTAMTACNRKYGPARKKRPARGFQVSLLISRKEKARWLSIRTDKTKNPILKGCLNVDICIKLRSTVRKLRAKN